MIGRLRGSSYKRVNSHNSNPNNKQINKNPNSNEEKTLKKTPVSKNSIVSQAAGLNIKHTSPELKAAKEEIGQTLFKPKKDGTVNTDHPINYDSTNDRYKTDGKKDKAKIENELKKINNLANNLLNSLSDNTNEIMVETKESYFNDKVKSDREVLEYQLKSISDNHSGTSEITLKTRLLQTLYKDLP